jgi:hypothetical protein
MQTSLKALSVTVSARTGSTTMNETISASHVTHTAKLAMAPPRDNATTVSKATPDGMENASKIARR